MKFDPDKPFIKVRSMTGVRFHQDGHEFSAGYVHLGKLKKDGTTEKPEEVKKDVRARAKAKIAAKTGNLDGFKKKEAPDAVESMLQENDAARQAEENAE